MLPNLPAQGSSNRTPTGLVTFATLIGVASGLGLLLAGLALIGGTTRNAPGQLFSTGMRLGLGFAASFFILGIIASVALVRFENWARAFCIGVGFVLGYWGTLFVADIAVSAATNAEDRGIAEIIGITLTTIVTALGFASSLYLLRPDIAARFGIRVEDEPRPVAAWSVAWILLASCLTTIPEWLDSSSSTFFGAVFFGAPARVADSLWTLAALALAIGLYKRAAWAFPSAVGYYLFCIADILVDLTPKARAHHHALMLQHKPSDADPHKHLIWLIVALVVLELTPLIILLAGRKTYSAWRARRTASAANYSLSVTGSA